ncbi:MAG: oligosaccharide flippase family protein [Bacteriodetes bacterium]|nr:oligosaccharide flippase family protein [Bacteroidota bacterium]
MSKLRTLASDTVVYGTSTIVQRFLTFMLTPIYTNFLTKTELGDVVYIWSVIAFLNVLYSFGFESAFLRFYKRDDENRFSVYTHAFLPIVIISGLVTMFTLVAPNSIANLLQLSGSDNALLIRLAALIPFADAIMLIPFARLRMERKAKQFAFIKFLLVVINVALNIILVVWLHKGALAVMIAGVTSSAFGALLFVPSILKHLKFEWNADLFSDLTAFGLPTLPSGFSAMMLQVADRPILRMYADAATVGLYNANYRLGIPMMLFVSVFEYAWKPFYLSHAADADAKQLFSRVLTYFTVVCAGLFLVLSLFIGYVVQAPFIGGRFINEAYWSGLHIIPIVAAAYFFNGLATNFASGLHITKRTRYIPLATGSAAITNIALNLILIPSLSYTGAAWATFAAYAVSAIVMYLYSQREFTVDYDWSKVGLVVAGTVSLYAVSTLIPVTQDGTMLLMRIAILSGFVALLYALGFFTANQMAFVKRFLKRG